MNSSEHKNSHLQQSERHNSETGPTPVMMYLRLYVADGSPNSVHALANLRTICQTHPSINFEVDIVDIWLEPGRALADGILVTPTLRRLAPLPEVKIIGDLSDTRTVSMALGIERVQQ